MNTPKEFYTQQLNQHTEVFQQLKKKLVFSSILRLVVFLIIAAGSYIAYPNVPLVTGIILSGSILFIWLVTRHSKLTYAKNKQEKLIEINMLELQVLEGNYKTIANGSEFIEPEHPYSHDIDLFGNRSFYQFLNRTTTEAGSKKLADILSKNDIAYIQDKQAAIGNLSHMAQWRQEYSATAQLANVTVGLPTIMKWLHTYTPFVPKIMRVLPNIITGISVVIFALLFLEIISFNQLLIWLFIGLGITGIKLKQINKLYSNANQVKDTFEQYYKLLEKVESTTFEASILKEKQQRILREGTQASKVVQEFAKILNAFDQRNNMIFGVVANGFFLWDLRQSYRIEKWIEKNHQYVREWFDTIAFYDAYNSLGNFAFNHPDYIFPELVSGTTTIQAKNLGHPMLNPAKRVDNDITIDRAQFFIITGANMAGKSTFLRTIALQIVMSNAGLPVCATSCSYQPIKLISSMRTSDSLSDDASYFFSELTQLKKIVDALEDDAYFIILDEILKGTNSKDKAAGSKKFVEKLVKAKATGIIATHDLSLCAIADELPEVENRFFDAQIVQDELYFDYTFKEGVCQNMNASFLLKKMGIVES
ncbi:MutS-related protein [Aquimarina intermedia]|uniref:MutS-like protein n=1 Tax=Aquimarina intermedia TaxID=350814 RepID=A0A5S5CGS0_9FLAO|nr:DNA mismatch repair protein MutS [Aquimarina intermedia]TYP77213.1 MutS-like protein [Aquimarina intermedia]